MQLPLRGMEKEKYAPKLRGKHLVFVNERECISLKSIDGNNVVTEEVEKLCSSHEEADTRIILHCNDVAANSSESSVILLRSPDTDVFILLLRLCTSYQPDSAVWHWNG